VAQFHDAPARYFLDASAEMLDLAR